MILDNEGILIRYAMLQSQLIIHDFSPRRQYLLSKSIQQYIKFGSLNMTVTLRNGRMRHKTNNHNIKTYLINVVNIFCEDVKG